MPTESVASWFGRPTAAWAHGWDGFRGDWLAIYAWFVGLQALDVMSTMAVLARGGLEGNPNAAWALGNWGWSALVGAKVVLVAFTLLAWLPAMEWLDTRPDARVKWARPTMSLLVLAASVYYSGVVFHNLANLAILVR